MDSLIDLDDGSQHELRVPSGGESGLKRNKGFTVTADAHSAYTIDFDLRKSVVKPNDQPGYFLKPVLRLVGNVQAGAIRGTMDAL